jgi:hypothetical protein
MIENRESDFRNFNKIFWILLVVLLAEVFYLALVRQFDYDEFDSIHSAWKLLAGEKIYVDFFHHHHPFFYYCLAGVIATIGERTLILIVMRILSYVMLVLLVLITYRFALSIFKNRTIAFISAFLLAGATIFIDSAIEIRADVPQTLCGLLSFAFVFVYFDNKRLRYLVSSAVLLGISFLLLQKGVFSILLMAGLLAANAFKKHILWRDVFVYAAAGILTVAPYYIYLLCSGTFSVYFTFNWLINMKWLNRFTAFNGLGVILRDCTLLAVFYILGLIRFPKITNEIRIGWLSLGFLASNFLIRCPYDHNFMLSIPFMAIIAGNSIYRIFVRHPKGLAVVLIIAFAVPSIFVFNRVKKDNRRQLEIVEYVLSITDPTDRIYDGNAAFNIFRKDIDFFWFSIKSDRALATYQTMAEYNYDIYKLIEKFKPKIISGFRIDNMQVPVIADHYIQSDVHKDLFIRSDGMK